MRRIFSGWSAFALAILVPAWLLIVPATASAQRGHSGGGGSRGGGGGGSHAGGSGGSHAGGGSSHAGGGSVATPRAGSGGSTESSRGGSASGSDAWGSTRSRGTERGGSSGGSGATTGTGTAVQRGSTGGSGTATGTGTAVRRGSTGGGSTANADPADSSGRPLNGRPVVGKAVPRKGPPPRPGGDGGTVFVPVGYYPWGYGGIGLGGYYGGYYDPYDPYDPYGGGYGGTPQYGSQGDSPLRLKIKPRDASVYVDGYFAGLVDDFDGFFQRLHLDSGPHRLEIRAPGYETLAFDVQLVPDRTTTYTGELRKIQ